MKGYSITFGKSRKDNKYKIKFHKTELGKVRPSLDGEICIHGIRLDLVWGRIRRPIGKFWKKDFWTGDTYENERLNAWYSGNHWVIIDIPFSISPFCCWVFGNNGSFNSDKK